MSDETTRARRCQIHDTVLVERLPEHPGQFFCWPCEQQVEWLKCRSIGESFTTEDAEARDYLLTERTAHAETVARLEQELAAEVAARKRNREEAFGTIPFKQGVRYPAAHGMGFSYQAVFRQTWRAAHWRSGERHG